MWVMSAKLLATRTGVTFASRTCKNSASVSLIFCATVKGRAGGSTYSICPALRSPSESFRFTNRFCEIMAVPTRTGHGPAFFFPQVNTTHTGPEPNHVWQLLYLRKQRQESCGTTGVL